MQHRSSPSCGPWSSRRRVAGNAAWSAAVLLTLTALACGDDNVSGPDSRTAVTVLPAAGPPGSLVQLNGVPASGQEQWVEVGGHRTPLLRHDGQSMFVVPAFLEGEAVWPAPPAGALDVEVHSAGGIAAVAKGAFTVLPLQEADGTGAAVAADLDAIVASLTTIADAIPAGAGESARFLFAISRTLDSLQHHGDYSVAAALDGLLDAPDLRRLTDALIAANGFDRRVSSVARTLSGVASGMPVTSDQFLGASAGTGPSSANAPEIDALSDDMLSQLMQLAVYLKQNTEYQAELGKQLSSVLSLAGVLGINADKHAPVAKVLDAIAAVSSIQALVVNTYVVSSLPSRLDSITIELAADTIGPAQQTNATVEVFASNNPDPVSIGDYISVFQTVAGLFAKGDYFEKAANFVVGKAGDMLKWFGDNNSSFEYDADIADLWSMPDVSFRAVVQNRDLVVLKAAAEDVVAPLPEEVNWVATATDSSATTITAQPSVGPANIPILMEWAADFISENSGDPADLVLGSFGEDLMVSRPVDVWVNPVNTGILFTFDDDLEGWQQGTTSGSGWGTARWQEWCGSGRDEGCVKLDGVGGGAAPNAWVYRTIELPPSATTLEFLTSAHNRAGSGSEYRVRLIDGRGFETILINWTATSGTPGDLSWSTVSVSIAAWAGETVTLYLEGRDNGPGIHEQRYYDDVLIY